jgi:hypothetical protein
VQKIEEITSEEEESIVALSYEPSVDSQNVSEKLHSLQAKLIKKDDYKAYDKVDEYDEEASFELNELD